MPLFVGTRVLEVLNLLVEELLPLLDGHIAEGVTENDVIGIHSADFIVDLDLRIMRNELSMSE